VGTSLRNAVKRRGGAGVGIASESCLKDSFTGSVMVWLDSFLAVCSKAAANPSGENE
jgi:hypothetical protein